MQHYLWTSLLSVNPTGPSGRDRGLAIGRGNAGRLSGVKASSNITRELTGATELQGRIRSCLLTFCLFVFLVFFLCALGTQSVVCKIQTELPVPNLWPNSLGFRQHHRRCTVTGRWTWCNYYSFYVCCGWGWGRLKGESCVLIEGGVLNRVWLYIYIFFFSFSSGNWCAEFFWRVGWVFLGIFSEFFLPTWVLHQCMIHGGSHTYWLSYEAFRR